MQKRWWFLMLILLFIILSPPPSVPTSTVWRSDGLMDIGLSMHGNQIPVIVDDEAWWDLFTSSGFTFLLSHIYTVDSLLNQGDYNAFTDQLPYFTSIADRMDGTGKQLIIVVDAGEGYTDAYFTALISFLNSMQSYADQVTVAPYYAEWFNYLNDVDNRYRNGGAGETQEGETLHDWTDPEYVLDRMELFMGYTDARGFQNTDYVYNVWPYGAVSGWVADGDPFHARGMTCSMNTGVEPPTMPEHKAVMGWIDSRYPDNGVGLDLMQWSGMPNQYYTTAWVNEALNHGAALTNCARLSFGGDSNTINYVASTVETYTGGAAPPPPPDPPSSGQPVKVKYLFLVDQGASLTDIHLRQTHNRHNLWKLATLEGKDLYIEY